MTESSLFSGSFEFGDWRFPEDMPREEKKKIKAACRYKLLQAIKRGTIKKPGPPCLVCLSEIAPLEAHHYDYRKPLEVFWCCKSCHYKHHHHPGFFHMPEEGEIEELSKASNAAPFGEAWRKLFIYPWPILSIEAQAEKAKARAAHREDERLLDEMERAEGAWLDACEGGDEETIAAAEQNLNKAWKD